MSSNTTRGKSVPDAASSIRVVIISDQKRGHENQSRVVARMLGDDEPLLMLLRHGANELPLRLLLSALGPNVLRRAAAAAMVRKLLQPEDVQAFRSLATDVRDLQGRLRLFCVSTGTPPATLCLVTARLLDCPAVVNMTPSLLPRRLFALNIVPRHDLSATQLQRLPANVIAESLALGYHDSVAAKHLAARLKGEHGLGEGRRYVGLAVGGPSKACPWPDQRILQQLQQLLDQVRQAGVQLLVTTSRRTPPWCLSWLLEHYQDRAVVPYFLDASNDPLNPLPAFYELCESIFVTEDSFSMVCEALHAGHRPRLLRAGELPDRGKLARAYLQLGYALDNATQEASRIGESSAAGMRSPANIDYERLRTEVRARLGLE